AVGHELEPPRNVDVTDIHDHLGWHRQGDGWWFYGMYVENGRIRDSEATRSRTALREIVTRVRPEVGVRLTPQQNVLITGIDERRRPLVERILADHGVPEAARLTPVRRWAMACPALPTCGLALAESERVLPDVLTSLEHELERLGIPDAHLTVRMTGCPNGCARPYTADLAFVGRSADRYTVYVGGTMLGTRLGVQYADLVRRGDLVAVLLPLLERYRAERLPNENFGDYVHRVGVEPVGARARAERCAARRISTATPRRCLRSSRARTADASRSAQALAAAAWCSRTCSARSTQMCRCCSSTRASIFPRRSSSSGASPNGMICGWSISCRSGRPRRPSCIARIRTNAAASGKSSRCDARSRASTCGSPRCGASSRICAARSGSSSRRRSMGERCSR